MQWHLCDKPHDNQCVCVTHCSVSEQQRQACIPYLLIHEVPHFQRCLVISRKTYLSPQKLEIIDIILELMQHEAI